MILFQIHATKTEEFLANKSLSVPTVRGKLFTSLDAYCQDEFVY